MARLIAGMTVSLDGFVADEEGGLGLVYPDRRALRGTAYMDELVEETGAVIMGRPTYDLVGHPDWYADHDEFQVPVFVVANEPPPTYPRQSDTLTVTFVYDGASTAVDQAKALAGRKAVTAVGDLDLFRQLVMADLVDELRVDIVPVVLGGGRRFLNGFGPEHLTLARNGAVETGDRTSLRFRVLPGTDQWPASTRPLPDQLQRPSTST